MLLRQKGTTDLHVSHGFEATEMCVMSHGFNGKMRQVMYFICVLYFLCSARLGLMHIGVFILLLLSGERNFGRFKSE